jgi:hypothetical protein
MKAIQTSNQGMQCAFRNAALLCLTAGAVLAVAQARAQTLPAFTIDFNDLLDGNPVVTLSPNLANATLKPIVTTGFEEAKVVISTSTLPFPMLNSTSLLLSEPSSDPFGPRVSDYVTISSTADLVTVFFASDGAADYTKNFPTTGNISTVLETGHSQGVSFLNNNASLDVTVVSDLNSPEVPDSGSTIGCLGIALAALAGVAWKVSPSRFGV